MKYASGERPEALADAFRHNLSVLAGYLKKNDIDSIEIEFAAHRSDDGEVAVEFGTVQGHSDSLSPAQLEETVNGLQDVEWTGGGIERQMATPVSFQKALRDVCLEAASLRDGEWKKMGGHGTVVLYGDGVADLTMTVLRPDTVGEEYYPQSAPLGASAGLPEPRPDGL